MMTLGEFFREAVKAGIKADPRGEKGVKKALKREKEAFSELSKEEKKDFDRERLSNPYADSRILFGKEELPLKRVLAGIDITPAEVLLAKELERMGKKIDLVLSHHPLGKALASLDHVMHLQIDVLESLGVPVNIAESLMRSRISEVFRALAPLNHEQAVDTARLLGIAVACVHTPADNLAFSLVDDLIKRKKPETVGAVIKILETIPEYKLTKERGVYIQVVAGEKRNRAGRVVVSEFTGGTNAGKEIYERLSLAGVGTILSMHMREEHLKEVKRHHLNAIVAPHIASDSLGFNQILDLLEKRGVEVIACSGLLRVRRL